MFWFLCEARTVKIPCYAWNCAQKLVVQIVSRLYPAQKALRSRRVKISDCKNKNAYVHTYRFMFETRYANLYSCQITTDKNIPFLYILNGLTTVWFVFDILVRSCAFRWAFMILFSDIFLYPVIYLYPVKQEQHWVPSTGDILHNLPIWCRLCIYFPVVLTPSQGLSGRWLTEEILCYFKNI